MNQTLSWKRNLLGYYHCRTKFESSQLYSRQLLEALSFNLNNVGYKSSFTNYWTHSGCWRPSSYHDRSRSALYQFSCWHIWAFSNVASSSQNLNTHQIMDPQGSYFIDFRYIEHINAKSKGHQFLLQGTWSRRASGMCRVLNDFLTNLGWCT